MSEAAPWLRPLINLWNGLSYRARYALLGALFGTLFPLTSSLIWVITNRLQLNLDNFLRAQVNNPLQWMIDSAPFFLGLFASFAGQREDGLQAVKRELENRLAERSRMVVELDSLRNRLEMQVSKQVAQLKLTTQVASDALQAKDLQQIMDLVVRLISERLGFYHAGIFLLDPTHEYAVLRASSSKGGQVMLSRNHRLRVGREGIVGNVAAHGEPRVAHDVGKDAAFFNNPDLPATRSEVALPLRIGDSVFGVLDIQSVKMGDFSAEDVAVLQTMADQVSMVIENARLASERREALQQLREFQARQSQDAWRTALADRPHGVVYDGLSIHSIQAWQPPTNAPRQFPTKDPYVLHQKIVYQDIPIGTLALSRPAERGAWSEAEKRFVQSVASQIALAVENARLLDENQRRAQSEQLLGEISARAHASLDLDAVMKISVQEIGKALGAMRVEMRLDSDSPSNNTSSATLAAQSHNGHKPSQSQTAEES